MKAVYNVEIGGIVLNLLSDEKEEYVHRLAKIINQRINDMVMSNKRCSRIEAALVCALDYLDSKLKAEIETNELKSKLSECQNEIDRLKKELDSLKST